MRVQKVWAKIFDAHGITNEPDMASLERSMLEWNAKVDEILDGIETADDYHAKVLRDHSAGIEQQKELFAFFGDVQQLVGVTLSKSCVMIPSKSVSGIFYSSEHDFQTCQLCRRENCSHRSGPFDPHMWESKLGRKA